MSWSGGLADHADHYPLFLVYAYSIILAAHLAPASFLAAMMFLFLQSVASLVALTHMFENIDISCRVRWHNPDRKG